MTTPQPPLGSGFGARSTAAEVVAGIDLTGRTAVVTGGYSGLGSRRCGRWPVPAPRWSCRRAARSRRARRSPGWPARPGGRARSRRPGQRPGVRRAPPRHRRRLDLLINNAAVMASPVMRVGPGWEPQFATNHLGHFALTVRLWPPSSPPAAPASCRSQLHRPQAVGDPVRRPALRGPATTSGRPTARPRPRTACSPCSWTRSAGARRSRLRRAPGRDHDRAAAPPAARRDGRRRAGWTRTAPSTSASRRRSRAPRPRPGPRRRRSSTGSAACTARTATSPADGSGQPDARVRGVDAHAVDRDDAGGCGRCRRS